jgi:hypothetical protein
MNTRSIVEAYCWSCHIFIKAVEKLKKPQAVQCKVFAILDVRLVYI